MGRTGHKDSSSAIAPLACAPGAQSLIAFAPMATLLLAEYCRGLVGIGASRIAPCTVSSSTSVPVCPEALHHKRTACALLKHNMPVTALYIVMGLVNGALQRREIGQAGRNIATGNNGQKRSPAGILGRKHTAMEGSWWVGCTCVQRQHPAHPI